ncbi:benzoate/H(+) symporter BenE family transporter [Serratia sp. PAMC26656]|uniref:benzoate/H(+) symporter BenE family transporter n=1 Tax=Serratia sp. PAMC26656 TaxID=2775909 RepID=UPI0018F4F62D|nr:benzoate/H(+) symporter BenE family transporter [Serratia sp. PAMC26656]MBJ7894026.1 benzoate/H(+) symporter BenE family transporter [Serratia sp. PAMC26656]
MESNTLMQRRSSDFSWQAAGAGLLSSFVGFASTFTLIVQALVNTGATQQQAATGLMAVSVAMGLAGILLSLKYRMPVSVAWSTPGAALLVGLGVVKGGFAVTTGALLMAAVMLIVAGLWKPLSQAINKIPSSIANAMLAGIILNLCVAPVHALASYPRYIAPVLIVWLVMLKINRILAIPCAAIATLAVIYMTANIGDIHMSEILPEFILVRPEFTLSAFISIALPLFIVTMASQNIPGMTVLNVNGYKPDATPLFTSTGVSSLLAAPFGGPAIGLAAITAAICAGDEAGKDPAKRYWAGIICGAAYIVYGMLAGAATRFISVSPPVLIEAVAGLALMGALGNSLVSALSDKTHRDAAIITFLITMGGHAFFGIGGAFWGLIAGIGMAFFLRRRAVTAA